MTYYHPSVRRPLYCRALGRILPMADALAMQEHLWQPGTPVLSEAGVPGRFPSV